jgi:hypothetical protein
MQNEPFLSYLKAEMKNIKSNKTGSKASAEKDKGEEEEEEDAEEDAEMNLDLDEEDMGFDMEDTDNMEGLSGEDDEAMGLDEEDDEEGEDEEEDMEEDEEDEEEEDLEDLDLPAKKKSKSSELDDGFFNLDDFNAMTEKQELDEDKSDEEDEEEIDYFADPDLIDSGDDDDEDDDFGNMGENEDEVDAHGMSHLPSLVLLSRTPQTSPKFVLHTDTITRICLIDVKYRDFFALPAKGVTKRSNAPRPSKEDSFFGGRDDEQDGDEDLDMDAEENDDSEEVNALGDRVSNLFAQDEDEEAEAGNPHSTFMDHQEFLLPLLH